MPVTAAGRIAILDNSQQRDCSASTAGNPDIQRRASRRPSIEVDATTFYRERPAGSLERSRPLHAPSPLPHPRPPLSP